MDTASGSLVRHLLGPNLRVWVVRLITVACGLYALVGLVSVGTAALTREDMRSASIIMVIGAVATLLQELGDRQANSRGPEAATDEAKP